jgi:hypothetical protein
VTWVEAQLPLLQQAHEEVDHFVVQPVEADHAIQIAPFDVDVCAKIVPQAQAPHHQPTTV